MSLRSSILALWTKAWNVMDGGKKEKIVSRKICESQSIWVAQPVKHQTLNFSSHHDFRISGSCDWAGSQPLCSVVSLALPQLACACCLSLSQIKKSLKKKKGYVIHYLKKPQFAKIASHSQWVSVLQCWMPLIDNHIQYIHTLRENHKWRYCSME